MSTSTIGDTEMTETKTSLTAQDAADAEATFKLLAQHFQENCTPHVAIQCSCGASLPATGGNGDWPKAQRIALVRHHAEVLAAAKLALADTPDQVTFSGALRTGSYRAPDGWTDAQWHRDATLDSGTSHTLVGPAYVIQCQWCPAVFVGERKADAMRLFRVHEDAAQGAAR